MKFRDVGDCLLWPDVCTLFACFSLSFFSTFFLFFILGFLCLHLFLLNDAIVLLLEWIALAVHGLLNGSSYSLAVGVTSLFSKVLFSLSKASSYSLVVGGGALFPILLLMVPLCCCTR